MRLLLDTHAVLWWLEDHSRLGQHARTLLGDPDNDVLVSVVSLWEIVVKSRVGKLTADLKDISDGIMQGGFAWLDIRLAHLTALAGLPTYHRDPFDHLLIAQALAEGAQLVSSDRVIRRYAVQVIDCSQ